MDVSDADVGSCLVSASPIPSRRVHVFTSVGLETRSYPALHSGVPIGTRAFAMGHCGHVSRAPVSASTPPAQGTFLLTAWWEASARDALSKEAAVLEGLLESPPPSSSNVRTVQWG